MNTTATRIKRMSPRQRKTLDPAKLNERFGLHFQGLIDAAGLTVKELRMRLAENGHDFSEAAIRHWMRGAYTPSLDAIEALGAALKLPDYRHVLPPPARNRRKK